jgi:hypothetical protein
VLRLQVLRLQVLRLQVLRVHVLQLLASVQLELVLVLPVQKEPEVFVEVETGSDSGLAVVSGLAIELEDVREHIPCNGGAVISLAPRPWRPLLCSLFARAPAPIRGLL